MAPTVDSNAKATPAGTLECSYYLKTVRLSAFDDHKVACKKQMVVAEKDKKKKENCSKNKATKK
ncbi:hypothetical protein FRX31_032688 [Thalictrum thalictroides]|uniref:Uncharacterized protein n=1 Tax=Thalictrum thalictroides TaxID=46969 RepID=A0A7J6V0D2_THATH|nr:hypothetical protein FRX31_032688 [Thalictrum thalictroides]